MKNYNYLAVLGACLLMLPTLQAQDFQWVNGFGGVGPTSGTFTGGIGTAHDGSIWATGTFFGQTINFDPTGSNPNAILNGNAQDSYLVHYFTNGAFDTVYHFQTQTNAEGLQVEPSTSGAVYSGGQFTGSTLFDTQVLNNNTNNSDIYLMRHDAAGNQAWVFSLSSSGPDVLRNMTTDDQGNLYVVGSFHGTINLDPNGSAIYQSNGTLSSFVASYDSLGNYLNGFVLSNGGNLVIEGIDLGANNDFWLCGSFSDSTDFDLDTTQSTIKVPFSLDLFLAHYTTQGDFINVMQLGGTAVPGVVIPADIRIDPYGNPIFSGLLNSGPVDFDPDTGSTLLTGNGVLNDIVLAKFTPNGQLLWVNQFGDIEDDYPFDMDLDANNRIYLTGKFGEVLDMDPGPGVANMGQAGDNFNGFLASYSMDGDHIWSMGFVELVPSTSLGSQGMFGTSVATGTNGSVSFGGSFDAPVDFDPSSALAIIPPSGIAGGFLSHYGTCPTFTVDDPATPNATCSGENVSINITVNGSSNLAFQWQENSGNGFSDLTNGPGYTGTTTNQLDILTVTGAQNGFSYRCLVTDTCFGLVVSEAVDLVVIPLPNLTQLTNDTTACVGDTAWFSVFSSDSNVTYQWQVDDGTGFSDITTGPVYQNYTSSQLTVAPLDLTLAGYQFRCVVTGQCDTVSGSMTLTVPSSPSIPTFTFTQDSAGTVSFQHLSTTGNTYVWDFGDGTASDTANNPSHTFASNSSYSITLTVFTQCDTTDTTFNLNVIIVGLSEVLSPLSTFNLFPNPTNDWVTLQWNPQNAAPTKIQVIDLTGRIVLQPNFNPEHGTSTIQLNIKDLPSGIYQIRVQSELGSVVQKVIRN